MNKICSSLAKAGFDVELVGFKKKKSVPLTQKIFGQKRLASFFEKGPLFFAETNIRLFFYLLFKKCDILCADDLDTALPVLFSSKIKDKTRVFDAHELFCEMHDIISRPSIYKIWKSIEKFAQPKFRLGYTENGGYASEYKKMYGVDYFIVMNSPLLQPKEINENKNKKLLIYQGAIERGRGFEGLIPAMRNIDAQLVVCGNGRYFDEVKMNAAKENVAGKIDFKGFVKPENLRTYTDEAYIGLNMNDNLGASFYYSLTNRFFDYMHAGIPQVSMNYPENKKINDQYEIAVLIDDLQPETIANAINRLLNDKELYNRLQQNCLKAREVYNWENEEKKLIAFYSSIQ
ncbi:hypothetical protein A9P82_11320 [Arachidicoccus ginsenosidimutans]|nr:hypothetical protein A9P82_11320 [Arachidicoccus sp. BS20]